MGSQALTALLSLQENYQRAGLVPPEVSLPEPGWVGTRLGIAGLSVLLGEGELDEILEIPPLAPIPGTKPWVMGVGVHRGELLPVISGDTLFRNKLYTGRIREFCMIPRHPGLRLGITLSAIGGHVKFPLHDRDMNHPVDADFADYTLGGFHQGESFLPILDIEKLVVDSELSCAAIPAEQTKEPGNA